MLTNSSRHPRLVYALVGLCAVAALGAGYQAIAQWRDDRMPPPGQLVDVGGHRLHLLCAGTGTPTVVLESGLGETSAYWAWISTAIARTTRVCAYDRAGRGWSEAAGAPQDGLAVADDLHALLASAHVPAPVVLVGHSSGAAYVRIFAGRYPEQVAGAVLLDGQPAEAFEKLPDYPGFYRSYRRVTLFLPALARLGIGRLVYHHDFDQLPAGSREAERRHYSSTRMYQSMRDEFAALPATLRQAHAAESFGDRPLVVVSASRDAQRGWLQAQDEMAALSAHSSHRIVPSTHLDLVMDQAASRASIEAIGEVVRAVRCGRPDATASAGTRSARGDF
jgi:pimeloyl-ACP methyl ester carboxylesterase